LDVRFFLLKFYSKSCTYDDFINGTQKINKVTQIQQHHSF